MSAVVLSESWLAKTAGWEAMKQARAYWAAGQVLQSEWASPLLRGQVQAGGATYRAGLLIRSERNVENLCTCRPSRERGVICAHSVAVGLHALQKPSLPEPPSAPSTAAKSVSPPRPAPQEAAWSEPILPRTRVAAGQETAQLQVVVAPGLEQAWRRGGITVCLEIQVAGKSRPLHAWPAREAAALAAEDHCLLERLEQLVGGGTAPAWRLSAAQWEAWLPALTNHPRVRMGKTQPLQVLDSTWAPALQAHLETNGELSLALRDPLEAAPFVTGSWVWRGEVIQPFGLPPRCASLFQGPIRLPRSEVPSFLNRDWPALTAAELISADFDPAEFILETVPPRFRLELAGGLAILEATLRGHYGDQEIPLTAQEPSNPPAEPALFLPDPGSPMRYWIRQPAQEQEALGRLVRAGFQGPDRAGRWRMEGQDSVLSFFAREYPRWEAEWTVILEERLQRSTARHLERIEPELKIHSSGSGTQWFDLEVAYRSSQGTVLPASEVQRLLRSGRGHTRLPNGRIALLDTGSAEELQEFLHDANPRQEGQGGYRVPATQAGFLEATRQEMGWALQASSPWLEVSSAEKQQNDRLRLGELESVLRPYQKAGVTWMQRLAARQWGGILADEMGLGKTLQSLGFLLSRHGMLPPGAPAEPSLVVCPTSLVANWLAEAARFTPQLKVLSLHGVARHDALARLPEVDLAITSYTLLRRDVDRYRNRTFNTIILDEAQHIKNRQTQLAQAIKGLRARHRFVLTGTPLENSVQDLWSIFDFLMPGYLGSAREFRDRYELPIGRDRCAKSQARLGRRVRPFLLRRLKRDVAPELPEKLEQVAYCELNDTQRALYEQVLHAGWQEILQAGGAGDLARSRLLAVNTLLRLRQICCDPRLLKVELPPQESFSAKLDLFRELTQECFDGGHRMLVFSQFVSMLALIREELEAQQIPYCYLDGSTRDRAAPVSRFQRDPAIPLFLISLKAGGLGLNLTGADTVIHFDPWWNPAVEAQATDRAHRLGQSRVVTSYKLITRGTVEEKILALQARKKELLGAMLEGDEQLAAGLSWDDMESLLAPGTP